MAGKHRFTEYAEKTGAVLTALLFWQLAAVYIDSNILIATPVDVVRRLFTIWRTDGFFSVIAFTFTHISIGYLSAAAAGTLTAFAAARFKLIERLIYPFVVCFKTVPVASMVVILLIWVSASNLSVIISFLVVFPVIYNNILSGLKACDRGLAEMAEVFGIGYFRKLRYITLPQLKSYIISALSVTAGMAWKAGVAAEVIGTPPLSVGKMIYQSKIWLNTVDLFTWTLILVVLSVIFERIFISIVKRLLDGDRR